MPTTARVNIWYPHNGNIGHASMFIGGHTDKADTSHYVSWWPATAVKSYSVAACDPHSYWRDHSEEGGDSHLVYEVEGLNITDMQTEWDTVRNKADAHYRMMPKNCSTVVWRILRAGGILELLPPSVGQSWDGTLLWTPKNIATVCNLLRDAGHATKTRHTKCPTKWESPVATLMGMR